MANLNHDPVTGSFLPGNTLCKSGGNPLLKYVQVTRQSVYAYWSPDKLDAINKELYDLCVNGSPRVKLDAIQYVHDRLMGKIKDELDVTVKDDRPAFDPASYSDDQLRQIVTILEAPAAQRPALPEPEPILVWPPPDAAPEPEPVPEPRSAPVKDEVGSGTTAEIELREAFELLDQL